LDGGKPNSVVDDHLSRPDNGPPLNQFAAEANVSVQVMRRYPRIQSDRLPSLCFVLHRMGFFVPRELLRAR